MKEKLKPCPFCGSERVKIIRSGADWNSGVECKDCQHNIYFFKKGVNIAHAKGSKAEEIAAITECWNRRTK